MPDFTLKINNTIYDTWDQVMVYKSMNSLAGGFGCRTSDFHPGKPSEWGITMNDLCTAQINGIDQVTGYMDRMPLTYGSRGYVLNIAARSKAGDLIDCPIAEAPNEWKAQTIKSIIEAMCGKFDAIKVVVDSSVAAKVNIKIPEFKADEGAEVADMILQLSQTNGIVAMSDGSGNILLTQTTKTNKATDIISIDNTTIEGKLLSSNENRFSKYIAKGLGRGTDEKKMSDYLHCVGEISDSIISRHRPKVILVDGNVDISQCISRARWEARVRAGKSRILQYTLPEWEQSDGKLWDVNMLVDVQDEFLDIDDEMLISDILFVGNADPDEGDYAVATIVDKSTYELSGDAIKINAGFDA